MIDRCLGGWSQADDIAVLGCQLVLAPIELRFELTDGLASLAALRQALRAWLAELDVDRPTVGDLLVAVVEAASNAIIHNQRASGPAPMLVARHHPGRSLSVAVTGSGPWRVPGDHTNDGGRGLNFAQVPADVGVLDGVGHRLATAGEHLGDAAARHTVRIEKVAQITAERGEHPRLGGQAEMQRSVLGANDERSDVVTLLDAPDKAVDQLLVQLGDLLASQFGGCPVEATSRGSRRRSMRPSVYDRTRDDEARRGRWSAGMLEHGGHAFRAFYTAPGRAERGALNEAVR